MATTAKDLERDSSEPVREGLTLKEMISKRDNLTSETGHYYGVKELSLRNSDPIKYERFGFRTKIVPEWNDESFC